jgi:hypothetical protein
MLRGSTVVIIGGIGSAVIWLALSHTIYKRLWIRGNNKVYYTLYRGFNDLEIGSEWLYMHFSVSEVATSSLASLVIGIVHPFQLYQWPVSSLG